MAGTCVGSSNKGSAVMSGIEPREAALALGARPSSGSGGDEAGRDGVRRAGEVRSCGWGSPAALGGRDEVPTAMMRIAKIADDDGGGTDGGGSLGEVAATGGASTAGAAVTGGISGGNGRPGGGLESGRGTGEFIAGRGGAATGRGATATAEGGAAATLGSKTGSEGERVASGWPNSSVSGTTKPGCDRRRRGGGELSGGASLGARGGALGSCSALSPENEMVGAIGAFKAPEATTASSAVSLAGGAFDGCPDSRRGFGGGASLRDGGDIESGTRLVSTAGACSGAGRSFKVTSGGGTTAGGRAPASSAPEVSASLTRAASSELSMVIQLSKGIRRSEPYPAGGPR